MGHHQIVSFDFELSDKQFENRYSKDFEQHYCFDSNFIRVEINPDAIIPDRQSFEDYLNHSLERSIIETGAKILIIDNLTYLKNETEKAIEVFKLNVTLNPNGWNTYDCLADDSMRLSVFEACAGMLNASKATVATIMDFGYIDFIGCSPFVGVIVAI